MCSAKDIYTLLKGVYTDLKDEEFIAYYVCKRSNDVFKTLVATILSQNSTDKSAMIAYKNLESKIGVDPDSILNSRIEDIISAIRVCGLANSKARYIINAARAFKKGIDFSDCEKLRQFLISIEGVGDKTADVVLVTCLNCKAFPVDTHIKRVITRLGILGDKPSYDSISQFFVKELNRDELLDVHHLLIAHGRRTCRARKPLCNSCVLRNCCEFYNKLDKSINS